MILEIEGKKLEVAIEENKEYYIAHSLCDCVGCRNFYMQAKEKYPSLRDFLEKFGVDISKPDEIFWGDIIEDELDYITVYYTVKGDILDADKYEIDITDTTFLSLVIEKGYVPNNLETEDYFIISVYGILLPYVLDEPFTSVSEEPSTTKEETKKRFRDFFKKRKNHNKS